MAKPVVNWEKVADSLVPGIRESEEFDAFYNEFCGRVEDFVRQECRERFVDPLSEQFKPEDEDEMEFVLSLEGSLVQVFWKKFVTQYLGREW